MNATKPMARIFVHAKRGTTKYGLVGTLENVGITMSAPSQIIVQQTLTVSIPLGRTRVPVILVIMAPPAALI